MTNYWRLIEAEWYANHCMTLVGLEDICRRTHEWVATFAQHPEFVSRTPSASVVIQRLLLRRLGEELRGVELLALNGHGFQAISAAANLFEQSHFLTFVSASDAQAERYRIWSDAERSLASVKSIVEQSGTQRGWAQTRIEQEYQKYRFLCGFKHNNGMMQRILLLPPPNDPDLVMGKLALTDSVWFVLTSVASLAVATISAETLLKMIYEVNALLDLVDGQYPTLVGINDTLQSLKV